MAKPNYELILSKLRTFSFYWDGKESILDLKKADYNWKQMEWIGFYFEHLCQSRLQPPLQIPGPSYGRVKFDAFWNFPWDFKAHVTKNKDNQEKHDIIINDKSAILKALDQYGLLGLFVAIGEADFNDKDRSFWFWHKNLKGELSDYERDRISRKARSRIRKVAFSVKRYCLYQILPDHLPQLDIHKQGRNSDGRPRARKLQLDLRKLKPLAEVVQY